MIKDFHIISYPLCRRNRYINTSEPLSVGMRQQHANPTCRSICIPCLTPTSQASPLERPIHHGSSACTCRELCLLQELPIRYPIGLYWTWTLLSSSLWPQAAHCLRPNRGASLWSDPDSHPGMPEVHDLSFVLSGSHTGMTGVCLWMICRRLFQCKTWLERLLHSQRAGTLAA